MLEHNVVRAWVWLSVTGLGIGAASGCGSDDLYVVGDVDLNESCQYAAEPSNVVSRPTYDVRAGVGGVCQHPYLAHLLVENPNDTDVVTSAVEISIHSLAGDAIVFDRVKSALPNPFRLRLAAPVPLAGRGVVEVEVLPLSYGAQLEALAGTDILVSATLSGRTQDGDHVSSNHFEFPVSICNGCRSACASKLSGAPNDACTAKHPEADGAICVDNGC